MWVGPRSLGGPYGAAKAHCCVAVDEPRSTSACSLCVLVPNCVSVCLSVLKLMMRYDVTELVEVPKRYSSPRSLPNMRRHWLLSLFSTAKPPSPPRDGPTTRDKSPWTARARAKNNSRVSPCPQRPPAPPRRPSQGERSSLRSAPSEQLYMSMDTEALVAWAHNNAISEKDCHVLQSREYTGRILLEREWKLVKDDLFKDGISRNGEDRLRKVAAEINDPRPGAWSPSPRIMYP